MNSENQNSMEIRFPETLVELWDYSHNQKLDITPEAEDWFGQQWLNLQNMLAGILRRSNLPGIRTIAEASDAASEFLMDLFQGPRPEYILNSGALIGNLRKYLAQKRNPAQYELSQILCSALRTLEREGKIKRDGKSKEHRVTSSSFARADYSGTVQATMKNYESNKGKVPFYHTKVRGNDLEKSRLIAPADAQDLVLHLLDAFGGWTKFEYLLSAMRHHVAEIPQFESLDQQNPDDEEKSNSSLDVKDPQADQFINEFDSRFARTKAYETAGQIWERICKINDKLFCLYYLPATFSDYFSSDSKLEDFGSSSTAFDQNKRIEKVMRSELEIFRNHSDFSEREKNFVHDFMERISFNLHQKCTEKGHIVNLLMDDNDKETWK